MPPRRNADPLNSTRFGMAHVAPFATFMAFLLLLRIVEMTIGWDHPDAPWWRRAPEHFIYPLQSIACLVILWHYRTSYAFHWSWKWSITGAAFGVIGIGFWLLPTTLHAWLAYESDPGGITGLLGVAERREGFDPGVFAHPAVWWGTLVMRFVRAIIVVAFIEEIFWRGFMMRFVHDWEGDFWKQPFGKHSWKCYAIVTALFMFAHAPVDYAGAFIYGSLTYFLCVWSRNLGACVVMHALANLLMGIYAIQTGKYGLW
jgi:uncharacterized protein